MSAVIGGGTGERGNICVGNSSQSGAWSRGGMNCNQGSTYCVNSPEGSPRLSNTYFEDTIDSASMKQQNSDMF
jgi:hypothetical protein